MHLSSGARNSATFPDTATGLPDQFAPLLFEMSSTLPPSMVNAAANLGYKATSNSRGFLYNLYFRLGSADLLYMSTFDPGFASYCPSHQLLAEAAAAAFAEGVNLIEMGRGDEPYKFDLGASRRHLRDLLAPG